MRKVKAVFGILGMVVLGFSAISVMAAQSNFSGVWVLDKGKTRSLPHGLKNYTMVVTQNEQQLVVESTVEGGSGPEASTDFGGYLGTGSMATEIRSGSLASAVVKPYAIYSLDGKETTAEQLWGTSKVKSRFKAKWSKDGKTLDLTLIQRDKATEEHTSVRSSARAQTSALTIREHWTLLEGGEALKVQHSVEVPVGADTVTLVFRKGQDKPQAR
jgi:hypothetical protein